MGEAKAQASAKVDKFKLFEKLGYIPNDAQRELHLAMENCQYGAMFGAAQIGKSLSAAKEALVTLLTPAQLFFHKKPPVVWIVAPNYSLGEKEFRYIYMDICDTLQLPVNIGRYDVRSGNMHIELTGLESQVIVKSADNPASLLGDEFDLLILSEGSRLTQHIWDVYLSPRIGTRKAKVICNTTPAGMNWVYDTFYVPSLTNKNFWSKIFDKTYRNRFSVPVSSEKLQPDLESQMAQAKASLPPAVFEEQWLGKFTHYSGLVYDVFSRNKHMIPSLQPKESWPIIIGIDPHPSKPTAVIFVTLDPYDRLIVYDEIYQKLLIKDLCTVMKAKLRGRKPLYTVIDTIAHTPDPIGGGCIADEFEKYGFHTVPAHKIFDIGFEAVYKALLTEVQVGDVTTPSLLVTENCVRTLTEFEKYAWEENGKPVKEWDDCLDAIRYVVASRPDKRRYVKVFRRQNRYAGIRPTLTHAPVR